MRLQSTGVSNFSYSTKYFETSYERPVTELKYRFRRYPCSSSMLWKCRKRDNFFILLT